MIDLKVPGAPHVRAIPSSKGRIGYYFPKKKEFYFIGFSWVGRNGEFSMSPTLLEFVKLNGLNKTPKP